MLWNVIYELSKHFEEEAEIYVMCVWVQKQCRNVGNT